MQPLRSNETVAAKLRDAISECGLTSEIVAAAAGIMTAELESFLNGGDIELCKLADVGGFLRIPLPALFGEVNE